MSIKKTVSTLFIILNLSFSYTYSGLSISQSEDVDAINLNPAGLAIDHGKQDYIFLNKINDKYFSYAGTKVNGFGYSIGYSEDNHKIFSPDLFRIGFATTIHTNMFYGIVWDKNKTIDAGIIYRPFNFTSLGWKSTLNHDFSNFNSHHFSIALRPFNSKILTLGFDQNFDNSWDIDSASSSFFLKTLPFKGIELSAKISSGNSSSIDLNKIKDQELSFNIGFDLGQGSIYTNSNNDNFGIGFSINSDHKKPSLIKSKKNKFVTLSLNDVFIEEKPITKSFSFRFNIFGNKKNGTQLRTWIEKVDKLSIDPTVEGLIINFKSVNAGLGKRSEIRNALKRFKESGKKIIVYSEFGIENIDYHLLSIADEIFVNPLTGVDLRGLSMEVTFYRGLLDSLKIEPHIWRVDKDGKSYKTAGEPFLNTKMSEEMKENYSKMIDDFYEYFVNDIADSRDWSIDKTKKTIDNGPYWSSQRAIDAGLINGIKYTDEFSEYVKKLTKDKESIKFSQIYKKPDYDYHWKTKEKSKIAIIYAVGGIQSGNSNPGLQGSSIMGDKTIMKAIKTAREDKSIEAIILRIDSGGGSALASDQMWREILRTTELDTLNKKPFIASMSDVAASGGYYIACQADTIISYPTTVTGSIGVISMGFNLSELYKKIGVNKEVIKRGEFSDLLTQSRKWSKQEIEIHLNSIEDMYLTFKQKVITGRETLNDINKLDDIALGRVWSGKEAKINGLVDEIGGINETIKLAKKMAGISKDVEIEIVEYPMMPKNSFKINSELDFLLKLLPESFIKELNKSQIIPILKGEKLYFIMPYDIKIN
jgi:protease-4